MKILLQSRTTLFEVPGGDTVQVLKTAEFLRKKGHSVDVSLELEPDVSQYDVVHLFNLMRPQETYVQSRNAKRQGKVVALSTIYGTYAEYEKKTKKGIPGIFLRCLKPGHIEYLKVIARAVKNNEINKGVLIVAGRGYGAVLSEIVKLVDIFLPNSFSEMERVSVDFPGCKGKPYTVVPNAIDAALFNPDRTDLEGGIPDRFKNCIVCAARIEVRKNQLNLVRAVKNSPWTLVLIGNPAPNHASYYEQVKREAGPNVFLLGRIPHHLLPAYYKAAKVHCLASWMETPGLSSLEAGAMGCNLVITKKGDTYEYFGDDAFYCDPDSVKSIRGALAAAFKEPARENLRKRIFRYFTWENTAEKTLEGYNRITGIANIETRQRG